MLVRAFANDPLMHFLFAEAPVGVEGGIARLMDLAFETRSARGWPVLGARSRDGRLQGVAYVSLPSTLPSLARASGDDELRGLRRATEQFEEAIGEPARLRYARYEEAWTVGAPQGPHHYLGVLGVAPEAQGQGIGRLLLSEVAALVDGEPNSEGVWLDTENPRNVAFYEGRGFTVAAVRPLGPISIWGMWRPRTVQAAPPG